MLYLINWTTFNPEVAFIETKIEIFHIWAMLSETIHNSKTILDIPQF